ncbi:MAG: TonB-dependent receptor plug domain-containing protein, partial [Aquificaceae bacterium]
GSNVFKAIELTPSLNVQTDDAYGLGGGSIRLRGFDGTQIGTSIDNMPLNDSGNFALYPHEYADVENLETITIERGAVSKKSPFYTEVGGAIRIRTRPPANKFGVVIFPRYGTENFKKLFFRVDTGRLPLDLKAFASYSHSEADKWKGPGKHPEYRDHYTIGLQQNLG